MSIAPNTNVRMFGSLHTIRRWRGQAPFEKMYIPAEGRTGLDLAKECGKPL